MNVPIEFAGTVQWRPWGEATMAEASERDKPLFVTVHDERSPWSWAMAESFGAAEATGLLNADFIPVFADARAHPGLAIAGQALCRLFDTPGWPLNLVLTPNLNPIFATAWLKGTGAEDEPSLSAFLPRIKWLWLMKRAEVEAAGVANRERWEAALRPRAVGEDVDWRNLAQRAASTDADSEFGGWGEAPKFPWPWRLCLEARMGRSGHYARSLMAMLSGGLCDRVAGGFHDFCSDRQWFVPRLGRSLSTQAALALAALEGAGTGRGLAARMLQNALIGGRSLLCDGLPRDGEVLYDQRAEWKKFAWHREEVCRLLGDDGPLFCDALSISDEGWLRDPMTGRVTGTSVPAMTDPLAVARAWNLSAEVLMERLEDGARHLQGARRPVALSAWTLAGSSGLFALALVEAAAQGDSAKLDEGREMLWRLRTALWDGRQLCHGLRNGEPVGDGTLDDYAALCLAAIRLAESSGESEWLGWAETLAERCWSTLGADDGTMVVAQATGLPPLTCQADGTAPSPQTLFARVALALGKSGCGERWSARGNLIVRRYAAEVVAEPGSWASLIALAGEFAE